MSPKEIKEKHPVELRTKWECPEEGGVPLLTMPNLPKPTHTLAPRNIFGKSVWDTMRKRGYFFANYKSEISGEDGSAPGGLHFHEGYSIDYETGTSTFKRGFAITPLEHVYFIHSGRAITLYKNKNYLYSAPKLLEGAEHGFKLIYEWNKAHPDEPKLKCYNTFLDYLKEPDLIKPMEELIKKYEIEFWTEDKTKRAPWGEWKVVIGNKEYPTPYKDIHAWEEAMKKQGEKDSDRLAAKENPFKGGVWDEVEAFLKED